MPTKKEVDDYLKQTATTVGVPYEKLSALQQSESGSRFDIGYHDKTQSSAMGLFGITKGFAQRFPDLNREDWRDNITMAARGLREEYEHFGNWDDAAEAHKLGRGGVGNAEIRARHPKEAEAADRLRGMVFKQTGGVRPAFPGQIAGTSTLYPNPYGNPMDLETEMQGIAEQKLDPLTMPRRNVLPERSGIQEAVPALFSNIATAISGNPLYQAGFQEKLGQETQLRERQIQSNLEAEQTENLASRQEAVRGQMMKLDVARQRLQNAKEWEADDKLAQRQYKMMQEQARLHKETAESIENIRYNREIEQEMIRQGFRKNATSGEWEVDPLMARKAGAMTEDQVQTRIAALANMLNDNKRNKKADPLLNAQIEYLQYLQPRALDNVDSIIARIEEKYGAKTKLSADYLHTVLLKNPWVPGAPEFLKALDEQDEATVQAAVSNEGGATKPATPAATAEEKMRERETGMAAHQERQLDAMRQRGDLEGWVSEKSVKQGQKKVEHWKDFVKNLSPMADPRMIEAGQDSLAKAYQDLEKARKNAEIIKNKGKAPAKPNK